ncbi:CaiB/BaiF CoA transferase family protein [Denitratisoma oestradiolicum]|uniref:Formyl-CoA transferase n=1 Tax=Denitratisoma oestradiolicum TaxID=311182 RepID=A0A6S6Y2M9_9PROT|nr:CaiB/BaiF CoA-transferase family protein [Denitratisoma oestradiolicum]TWO79161.1 formyl-CoA transferase [Denitratisoma oestradiolicum]CAB1369583.1 Formyl-CoA transferase [Denitratisoma oestradiolicum]
MQPTVRPLSGLRVIEFTHMVMGPAMGMILADLGAEVIKIEPVKGDNTRRLLGSGAGYFPMYNRNKQSLAVDTQSEAGGALVRRLINRADVLIENFKPGGMAAQGFGYDELSRTNPGLIYCSAKGFLSGPYEHRTALDEVAQMMGGLAHMTGLPDRPMRAGASVIDVTGAMFGVIGILAALEERHRTGLGKEVKASLYETTAFLVGQHMAQYAVTGKEAPPMSVRLSAWAVYDIFEAKDGERVFIGVVSDTQWKKFCEAFRLTEFSADRSLDSNSDRVLQRERILSVLIPLFKTYSKQVLMDKLEHTGLPFAPVARPVQLFDDPHLSAEGGLVELTLPGGSTTRLPALPLEMDGQRAGCYRDLPAIGESTSEVLSSLGLTAEEICELADAGVIGLKAAL